MHYVRYELSVPWIGICYREFPCFLKGIGTLIHARYCVCIMYCISNRRAKIATVTWIFVLFWVQTIWVRAVQLLCARRHQHHSFDRFFTFRFSFFETSTIWCWKYPWNTQRNWNSSVFRLCNSFRFLSRIHLYIDSSWWRPACICRDCYWPESYPSNGF